MPLARTAAAAALLSLVATAPVSLVAAAPPPHRPARPVHPVAAPSGPVLLAHRPLTAEDAIARQLTAPDLRASNGQGDPPLVLVGSARLGPPGQRAALFVQLQSADLCGSAGCSTSVYLQQGGGWKKVLDSISGPIRVDARRHDGMADLIVGDNDRWVWTGSSYADTVGAPPIVDLRRSVAQHRAALARHRS